jgi:hypothetical protein
LRRFLLTDGIVRAAPSNWKEFSSIWSHARATRCPMAVS